MNIDITDYLDSWINYHVECALRTRNRAKLNADGWRKLRQYHLEQYVKGVESPFFFVFVLKFKYTKVFNQIPHGNLIYTNTLEKRNKLFKVVK